MVQGGEDAHYPLTENKSVKNLLKRIQTLSSPGRKNESIITDRLFMWQCVFTQFTILEYLGMRFVVATLDVCVQLFSMGGFFLRAIVVNVFQRLILEISFLFLSIPIFGVLRTYKTLYVVQNDFRNKNQLLLSTFTTHIKRYLFRL